MGFGGAINDLIDTLNRPVRRPTDANPMYAYRRLPQNSVTKRLPEGHRGGQGAMHLRQIDPDYGFTWRSHLAGDFDAMVDDLGIGYDPAEGLGPKPSDRVRAMVHRDAEHAAAQRMVKNMEANSAASEAMARAADGLDLEIRARRAGRKFPFDSSVKYGSLPSLDGVAPSPDVMQGMTPTEWIAKTTAREIAGQLIDGEYTDGRRETLRSATRSPEFGMLAPEIQQAVRELIDIGEASLRSDSVTGDRARFADEMRRIANPPRVGGETALDMLKRGGGAMGLPALDVLSILMGAAVGRNPIDPGPLPGTMSGPMLYKDTSTGEVFDEDGNSYLERSDGGYAQVY